MPEKKDGVIIKGPVHGFIKLSELQEDLLSQPEVQRLAWVKQLGLVQLVYPGAHHTRLEHSLGTSHLCGLIANKLDLNDEETKLLESAGLLHDLGHAPFSHAIEPILPRDHMEITKEMIKGNISEAGPGKTPEILKEHGVDPAEVADLVTESYGGEKYLQDIVSSQLDADQLDYLARDSHYTGVSYGAIEIDWLLNVMKLNQGRLTYLDKGVDGLEDFLVARDHMYSSVYRHKTADIAEKMLIRAVERRDQGSLEDLMWMTDDELLNFLKESSLFSEEMIRRIKERDLYKQAYTVKNTDPKEKRKKLSKVEDIPEKRIEGGIAEEAGLDESEVIVNKQAGELVKIEPRLREFNIRITKSNGKVVPLEEMSEIAKALKKKELMKNLFSVYTTEEHREKIKETVEDFL